MTAKASAISAKLSDLAIEKWRLHLSLLAAVAVAILLLFSRDALHMAEIWYNSSTYNHCLLIPLIIGWLVSLRIGELRQLRPKAWAPGLFLIGAGSAAWLLGEAGSFALARHTALILILQGAVVSCLGPTVSRGLAFPLFYSFFLIPAGEEIVPWMQMLTAEISMILLRLADVPAHIEGIFITIPSGYFRVAEACAGVKFLIAMIAYGALVANVCFRSWKRRILFMIAAVVIPIAANGVRAWGTIYVAHVMDTNFAAGFDHVVYGWIFFAVVIVILMAAGWPFFDRHPGDPWIHPALLRREERQRKGQRPVVISGAAMAIVAAPLLWSTIVACAGVADLPERIEFPEVAGWQRITNVEPDWEPAFQGADLYGIARYRSDKGDEVDLAIAVFARQEEGRELVGFGQGIVGPDSDWSWTEMAKAPPNGRADRIGLSGHVREVVSYYRVGHILTGSGARVKLETMKTRLVGGPQRAVVILVSAPSPAQGVSARPAIDAFIEKLGLVDMLADRAAGRKG